MGQAGTCQTGPVGRLSVLLQVCSRPRAAGGDPSEDSAGLTAVTSGRRRASSAAAPCRLAAGLVPSP